MDLEIISGGNASFTPKENPRTAVNQGRDVSLFFTKAVKRLLGAG
jgi:hypothetical protein